VRRGNIRQALRLEKSPGGVRARGQRLGGAEKHLTVHRTRDSLGLGVWVKTLLFLLSLFSLFGNVSLPKV